MTRISRNSVVQALTCKAGSVAKDAALHRRAGALLSLDDHQSIGPIDGISESGITWRITASTRRSMETVSFLLSYPFLLSAGLSVEEIHALDLGDILAIDSRNRAGQTAGGECTIKVEKPKL